MRHDVVWSSWLLRRNLGAVWSVLFCVMFCFVLFGFVGCFEVRLVGLKSEWMELETRFYLVIEWLFCLVAYFEKFLMLEEHSLLQGDHSSRACSISNPLLCYFLSHKILRHYSPSP